MRATVHCESVGDDCFGLDFFKGIVICKGSSSGLGGRRYTGDGDLDAAANAKQKRKATVRRNRIEKSTHY